MSSSRAVVFTAIVVLGTVLAVPFAGAFALTDAATLDAQDGETNGTDGNVTTDGNATDAPSVGAQVSSFMQTSATNATSEVESGMFEAEYERADNKSAVVEKRTKRIERQIEQLRERKRALAEREGDLNDVAYTARMSRIVGEIEALERQINGTAAKAERVGIDAERFDRMRANVSELRGPKVRAAADAIPGRGPPADRGPDERGQADDRGQAGDRGQADDRGGQPDATGSDAETPGSGTRDPGASDNASAGDDAGTGNDGGDRAGNDRGPSGDDGSGDGAPDAGGGDAETDADESNTRDARPDVTLVR
mgnify:CR=1 FL=1